MNFISSDTNIWLDFVTISRLNLPFLLPYTYIMSSDAMDDELLSPINLREDLEQLGLRGVEISEEEFYLAASYGTKFPRLSIYDRIALAIAKSRKITLLTGDKALRKAAKMENVPLLGTLGILDQLYQGNYIPMVEYAYCLTALQNYNGGKIRLPKEEINKRLTDIQTK